MEDAPRRRSGLGLAGVLAVAALTAGAAWIAPQWLLKLCAKEGPLEAASHVVLLAATLGWVLLWRREKAGAGWVALACAVVLAEELDWGAQLGFTALVDLMGVTNLHNALSGASYLFFAVPWVVLYGIALRGGGAPRWVPPRLDGVGFGLVALAAALSLVLSSAWERALDEVSELMLYVLLALGAMRSARL